MAPSHASALREEGGEALTGGVQAGRLSSEITSIESPTQLPGREGHTVRRDSARGVPGSRSLRSQGMYANFMHGNRESPGASGGIHRRSGRGRSVTASPTRTRMGSRTRA